MAHRAFSHAPLLALLALAGCSTVCDREQLPNAGDASTPEHLLDLVVYACKNHCWRLLYDHASEATRAEYGYLKFRVGFPEAKQPDSDRKIVDLLAASRPDVVSHYSQLGDRYRLGYLSHDVGGESRDLNVLLVLEADEDGKPEWHVAVHEQVQHKIPFE